MNKALRQALELQVAFLAARPRETSAGTFWESPLPQPGEGTKHNLCAGAVGSQDTSLQSRGRRGQPMVDPKRQMLGKSMEAGVKETIKVAGTEQPVLE